MCGFLITGERLPDLKFTNSFEKISYRGPDNSKIINLENCNIGFHRLSIIDTSFAGNQPFVSKGYYLVCNGEIYNHKELEKSYFDKYLFQSKSDCEVILPLVEDLGIIKATQELDGEFAFVIYDSSKKKFIAARDPIGIRPLFFGFLKQSGQIAFASEVKSLIDICDDIAPFPPGHVFDGEKFASYINITDIKQFNYHDEKEIDKSIETLLVEAVKKRMNSDVPVGYLLSGGLDSSLVCAIANRYSSTPITTFAVGINQNPIDTKYARIVSDYLGTDHHEVLFTKEEVFESLEDIIYKLETFDITTIRASIGMNLLCKYIKEETDIKVVLTGEVSDELFGYKYTDFAPSSREFQNESKKRVEELYMYDVLRADRSIASNSLEARVPFSDKGFIKYVMSLAPAIKMNTTGVGKYLLRRAFENKDYLPKEILYREKAAFSDAVGHSMVDELKLLAEETISDQELERARFEYKHATPFTKEALMYRKIFEKHFKGRSKLIKDFWMPNKSWKNCDVKDPSARVLPNYGASGV